MNFSTRLEIRTTSIADTPILFFKHKVPQTAYKPKKNAFAKNAKALIFFGLEL
ncbi:hypothetical protein [Desulfovibrio desulfuricans]|uniref:hypothetical protein n=1 Tax=Desulfovibrio desulfuricans TaxID=876 RepID=UPI001AE9F7C8|nr:hypothetical protein [Desulfovibrio desulfuricans]QTO41362.1 hypothetical protein J8J02_05545 [Desulfovibrio desulfuricans]